MPVKNSVKIYTPDAYYHLYNRGVEKRIIFDDSQDYRVFLKYLSQYLLPKDEIGLGERITSENSSWQEKDEARKLLRLNNFADSISLHAYCLMPNHFHFLVHQTGDRTIDAFMNSLFTRYSMYFNRKYKRVGPLFQSLYKAVRVVSDEQIQHLSRYIHRNPSSLLASQGTSLHDYPYSSYSEYIGKRDTEWVRKLRILEYFSGSSKSYQSFVEQKDDDIFWEILNPLVFEDGI